MVSLLEGRKNVGLCSFSVPPSRSFVVRCRAVSPRQEGCLPFGFASGARAALELEAIDSALTHSLTPSPSHPISLPPSITLFPSLLILRRSLGGLSFLASFPARGQVRYQDYVKGRPCPLSPTSARIISFIMAPLHSTSSHSLAPSLLYFLGSLSLPVARRRRQALRCRSFQMVQIAVMNKLNLRLPALQGRPLYLPFRAKRGSSFGLKKSVTFALAISDAL